MIGYHMTEEDRGGYKGGRGVASFIRMIPTQYLIKITENTRPIDIKEEGLSAPTSRTLYD